MVRNDNSERQRNKTVFRLLLIQEELARMADHVRFDEAFDPCRSGVTETLEFKAQSVQFAITFLLGCRPLIVEFHEPRQMGCHCFGSNTKLEPLSFCEMFLQLGSEHFDLRADFPIPRDGFF